MIIRLEIENFYSIKDKQVLDFRVPLTTPKSDRLANISEKSDVRVPKVIAFFGANASGKTTFLRAISFLQKFVERSFHAYEPTDPIAVLPFKRAECEAGMTSLAMEFVPSKFIDLYGRTYRYELSIQHYEGGNFVAWEALRASVDGRSFRPVFERRGSKETSNITAQAEFELPEGDPRRTVRSNVSLLSSLVQFAHEPAQKIVREFRLYFISNIALGKTSFSESFVTDYLKNNPDTLGEFNRLIRVIDVGIEDVELKEQGKSTRAFFKHSGLDGRQTLDYESQGTKNFFCLFPNLIYSLKAGATAVLDEIDSDLHAALMGEIIRWYHSRKENRYDAQLLMSCQNASILNDLEKEEVCLVEKDEMGESSARRLSDFGHIRRDANLYKKYMGGAFGAVPSFG